MKHSIHDSKGFVSETSTSSEALAISTPGAVFERGDVNVAQGNLHVSGVVYAASASFSFIGENQTGYFGNDLVRVVSPSGSAYSSIATAFSGAPANTTVVVRPADYTEQPFTIPSFCNLIAPERGVNIFAADNSNPFITANDMTYIGNCSIFGPRNSTTLLVNSAATAIGTFITDCLISGSKIGVDSTPSSFLNAKNSAIIGCTTGSRTQLNSTASLSEIDIFNCGNAIQIEGGTVAGASTLIRRATNGVVVGSAGTLMITTLRSYNASNYGMYVASGAAKIDSTNIRLEDSVVANMKIDAGYYGSFNISNLHSDSSKFQIENVLPQLNFASMTLKKTKKLKDFSPK